MATFEQNADIWKSWEKSGNLEFLQICKTVIDNTTSNWSSRQTKVTSMLYQLFRQVITGNVKTDQAVAIVNDIVELKTEISSHIADVFAVIDIETACKDDQKQRDKFLSLVTACLNIVPESILKERLEQETLESLSLIQSKQQFQARYVKVKTKLYYKQQKFNLLREESEGYAKLITELDQPDLGGKITPAMALENIKSLIGCFDLDPNRVLDIMLESFECLPEYESFFVPLLKAYTTEDATISHILGFKFHFYQEPGADATPDSLYNLAAHLLKHELILLDDLYPHLFPQDSTIAEHQKKIDAEAKQLRKMTVVVLSEKQEEKPSGDDEKIDHYMNNQKVGLVKALFSVGAWQNSRRMLDRFPLFYATSHEPVSDVLCALLHALIEPLYKKNTWVPASLIRSRCTTKPPSGIEAIDSFHGLTQCVFPMLSYIGPNLSRDPILMVKLTRIGKCYMTKRKDGSLSLDDEPVYYGFLTMLDEVLLPSLSLLTGNCCMSEEVWSFLKMFPYEVRYRMYGRWKNDVYSRHSLLIRTKTECLDRAKYIMKRLSKDNVKPSGRQIGKVCHNNPTVMFEYVLSQIQRFDNLIGPVVDAFKYLTPLSYDVLAFCLIDALANPERERMKHDDTNISPWLQTLANFAGSICKKYQLELTGLMQYVANQLKMGKSYDLLVLREVIQKMAGIEISEEVTNEQLDAMSGGELLKQEGGYFTQVRNTKKSSTRLKDTLLENELALSLCLLMAQQRDCVIYKEGGERHIKLSGKLYDQCLDTLVQFGNFLSMQLSTEEFAKHLPPIDALVNEYNVPWDTAFFLARPSYAHSIQTKFEELRKQYKSSKSSSHSKGQLYLDGVQTVIAPVKDMVRPLHIPKIWEEISEQVYVTFWSLTMYDLCTPSDSYERQIQHLKTLSHNLDDNHDMLQSKKKKERERYQNLCDKLADEEKRQNDHVARVMTRLKYEKDSWFLAGSTKSKNEMVTQFLQVCVFPRCCFTASDAVFCAKFIQIMHYLRTPNFSTLICYDRIFCDITCTLTFCTENEAHRYGRFLCHALSCVMRWHSEQAIYDKECASCPGFVTVFRKGVSDSNSKNERLDYENYRHICHKWHFRITKAMVLCLESGNYIQIRNALIILTRILPHYPHIQQFGQAVERRIDRLRQEEKEKRPDIYALTMGYIGQLKSKKSRWVHETVFHNKETKDQAAAKAQAQASKTGGKEESGSSASRGIAVLRKEPLDGKSSKENSHGSSSKDTSGRERKGENYNSAKSESSRGLSRGSGSDVKKSESDPSLRSSRDRDKGEKESKESRRSIKHEKDVESSLNDSRERERSSKHERVNSETKLKSLREIKVEKEKFSSSIPPSSSSRDREKEKAERREERLKERELERERQREREYEAEQDRESKYYQDDHTTSFIKEERIVYKERSDRSVHYKEEWPASPGTHERERVVEAADPDRSSIGSNSSHGSQNRRSTEPSPKVHYEDRPESKRRKMDPSASSKDTSHHAIKEKHKRTVVHENDGEWERKERKKEYSKNGEESEAKKRKSESGINGSAEKVSGSHTRSKDHSRTESMSPDQQAHITTKREVFISKIKEPESSYDETLPKEKKTKLKKISHSKKSSKSK